MRYYLPGDFCSQGIKDQWLSLPGDSGCCNFSRYGTIALCHFHEHFVHVADVGLERIKTRRICWHGDSDYCTVLPLTCNRGTRPCQVSVRLRHLSVNARSLKWDGMISWRENPASAPWEHKNTIHSSMIFNETPRSEHVRTKTRAAVLCNRFSTSSWNGSLPRNSSDSDWAANVRPFRKTRKLFVNFFRAELVAHCSLRNWERCLSDRHFKGSSTKPRIEEKLAYSGWYS